MPWLQFWQCVDTTPVHILKFLVWMEEPLSLWDLVVRPVVLWHLGRLELVDVKLLLYPYKKLTLTLLGRLITA